MWDLRTHFDSWCSSAGVKTFEELRELIILEQFKNSVSDAISAYIGERNVKTVAEAAALADDYSLTHLAGRNAGSLGLRESLPRKSVFENRRDRFSREANKVCNFCHKQGHWKNDCFALKARTKNCGVTPVLCATSVKQKVEGFVGVKPGLESYLPFITEGFVSLVGSKDKLRVRILRDTGAFDSFIVASTLPFSDVTYVGSNIPVQDMGMNVLSVPRHKITLLCDLFQGEVSVGVRPALPVDGVAMILGNDIAGSRVWADVPPPAKVTNVPLTYVAPWDVSHNDLLEEQKSDSTLTSLMDGVCASDEAYTLEIRHIKGRDNVVADALSRAC
ncbi:uncharacterized protein LOC106526898 [Austrofundulus limnaeus]|uniref:Uncharacterized protein LOC106526898 n=1 Tax=Austrofundulus limnaeus TaxID=52670 RepID=A0A2I4CAQ5_AUSLI|nr:PREDICTED: uncharacterized protein LOC106526898 [Austrofundulus limnaeus]